MIISASSTFGSNPLWYLTRSTGVVAFVLLTLGAVLGVAATNRELALPGWPRFATQALHRNVNLLGLAFVVVHVLTTVLDSYVKVGLAAIVVPMTSDYRPGAVAFGTAAFDVFLLVAATGLLRIRMTEPVWRAIHLAAYLAWPLSLIHFLKTGTDAAHGHWGLWLGIGCALCVGTAATARLLTMNAGPRGPVRSVAR